MTLEQPPGYAPSEHNSPSSLDLDERCNAAWGLRYLQGLREPEVPWAEIEAGAVCTSGQRSKALGTAGHAILEAYYKREPLPFGGWDSVPGKVVHAGLHLLPHPDECLEVWVESDLFVPNTSGVVFKGKLDLVARVSAAGLKRLGLEHAATYADGSGWVLFDYKTTSDFKWQKNPAVLRIDKQGVLYPWSTMQLRDREAYEAADPGGDWQALTQLPCRWVYFRTRGAAAAKCTDWVADAAELRPLVHALIDRASELDAIKRSGMAWTDLQKNANSCGMFAGCEYHTSKGGPCDARRRLGSLIQARVPKKPNGGLINMAESFAARKARLAAEAAGTAAPANPVQPVAAEPEPAPAPASPPPKIERAPAAAKAPKAAPTGPTGGVQAQGPTGALPTLTYHDPAAGIMLTVNVVPDAQSDVTALLAALLPF